MGTSPAFLVPANALQSCSRVMDSAQLASCAIDVQRHWFLACIILYENYSENHRVTVRTMLQLCCVHNGHGHLAAADAEEVVDRKSVV